MRDYSITKKSGQLHNCEVTDSYGNEYQTILIQNKNVLTGYTISGKMKRSLTIKTHKNYLVERY